MVGFRKKTGRFIRIHANHYSGKQRLVPWNCRRIISESYLLLEHDMKLVSGICEKLTVLNFGQVLAQGNTVDVLNDPEVIKAYLGE